MRRCDREMTDWEEMLAFLRSQKICRLALWDEEGPYILPLCFGFARQGETPVLYFHSAKQGRKVRAIGEGVQAAFELDDGGRVLPGETPCQYSCAYRSLTGAGFLQPVRDPAEKQRALSLLMEQQTGAPASFSPEQAGSVAVFRLSVTKLTGKQHRPAE